MGRSITCYVCGGSHYAKEWRPLHIVVFQTNTCDIGWGACIPEVGLQAHGTFMVDELVWPIHHKEMKVVELAIETLGHMLLASG